MSRFLIAAAILFASVVPSFASLTRIAGLGIQNWMIEDDDALIWLNPARVADQEEQIKGEWTAGAAGVATTVNSDAAPAGWGGGIMQLCDTTGIMGGLFIGRAYNGVLQAGNTIGVGAAGTDVTANLVTNYLAKQMTPMTPVGRLDAQIAYPCEKTDANYGLQVSYASTMQEDENNPLTSASVDGPVPAGANADANEYASSDLGLTLGVQKNDVGPLASLELIASYNMLSADSTENRDTYVVDPDDATETLARDNVDSSSELDSGANMGVGVRAILDKTDDEKVIAFVSYNQQDGSNVWNYVQDGNLDGDIEDAGDTDNTVEREQTINNMTIGIAKNKQVSENTLLIMGLSYNSQKIVINETESNNIDDEDIGQIAGQYEEYSAEQINTTLPLNLALETKLSNVVTCRLGTIKNLINKTKTEIDDPDFVLNDDGDAMVLESASADNTDIDDNVGAAVVTVGVGVQATQDLVIDLLARQQILFSGGYIASGDAETLATQLTATLRY